MPQSSSAPVQGDSPLFKVIADYWEAIESGQAQDQAMWVARHPEFQAELREFFADWNRMHSVAPCNRPVDRPVAAGKFGAYELLAELGRGGMGVVYKARQHQPQRFVALKMLRPGHLVSAADLRRFHEEVEAVARLDDPHIVPVYDMGEHQGVCFYTMKLLTGGSLAAQLSRFAADCRTAAELMVPVARAVHHAHFRGVLHRDLKPSNILLDANGRPYIADFGLSRRLETDLELTRSGELVGTPSYMAPEQTVGGKAEVTIATDVYGLGAVLYSLLTGVPPARGETVIETLRQIQEREPKPPRSLNPRVDSQLETICLKALRKPPQRRYGSALEFAEDLERYLAGQPILARPASRLERSRLWLRRSTGAAMLATTILAFALLLIAGLNVHNARLRHVNKRLDETLMRSSEARRDAVAEQQRAQRSKAEADLLMYISDMSLASEAQRTGDAGLSHDLLVRHRSRPGEPDHRGFEWHYLWRLGEVDQQDIASQDGAAYFTSYSPDGRWLATAGQDCVVRLYNADTFREELTFPTGQGEINGLAFSPEARLLATAGDDGTLRLWELPTGRQVLSIAAHSQQAYQVLFVPNSDLLISCGYDPVIRIWDRNTGHSLGELRGHERAVEAIALSPDASTLASVSSDETARVWDLRSLSQRRVLAGHEGRVVALAFAPDGCHLATGSVDKTVQIWRVATGDSIFTASHVDAFQSLAFSPDGRELAAGDRGGAISLWRKAGQQWSTENELVRRWSAHEGRVYSLRFLPDGRRLVSAAEDGFLTLWSRPTGDVRRLVESETAVGDMAWVGEGDRLATVDELGIHVWDVAAGRTVIDFATEQPCLAVAATADGRQLAAADALGQVGLWNLERRQRLVTWNVGQSLRLSCHLAFSPDNKLVALSSFDENRVWLLGAATGRIEHQFSAMDCCAAVFSPDGRRLAVSAQNDVLIWDVENAEFLPPLRGHTSTVKAVIYSPDGRYLATASHDRLVKLWDAATGFELFTLAGHREEVLSVAFSADSRSMVSGSHQSLRVWHVGTGRPMYELDAGHLHLEKLLFSSNGRYLASLIGGQQPAVSLYDTSPVTP